MLTQAEAIAKLDSIDNLFDDDTEFKHIEAEKVLFQLLEEAGLKAVVARYKELDLWYA